MTILEHPKSKERSLDLAIQVFLGDLAHANRSAHTRRAYASDLAAFPINYPGSLDGITPDTLRGYLSTFSGLSFATRARKQASLAGFLAWACKQDLIDADPMVKIDRVKLPEPEPRGESRGQVEAVLKAIPPAKNRDRLLFRLIYEEEDDPRKDV